MDLALLLWVAAFPSVSGMAFISHALCFPGVGSLSLSLSLINVQGTEVLPYIPVKRTLLLAVRQFFLILFYVSWKSQDAGPTPLGRYVFGSWSSIGRPILPPAQL